MDAGLLLQYEEDPIGVSGVLGPKGNLDMRYGAHNTTTGRQPPSYSSDTRIQVDAAEPSDQFSYCGLS